MEVKRPLAKASSIINIIVSVISTFYYGYASFAMYVVTMIALDLEQEGSTAGTEMLIYLIVMLLIFLLSIVIIVLSAIVIKNSKLSLQKYNQKKRVNVALILISLVVVALHIFYLMSAEFGFFSILNILIFGLTTIFLIADLSKNKKALKNAPAEVLEQNATSAQPEKPKAEESLEARLIKLNNLKEQGLITEEEYNSLKQDLLK